MRTRGARLGSTFGRLWAASAVSNVGDGVALGALGGGFVARGLGLTAPFWIAFTVMVVLTAVAWRRFSPALLDAPLDASRAS